MKSICIFRYKQFKLQKSQQPYIRQRAAIFYKVCLGLRTAPCNKQSCMQNRVYLAELSLDLILPHAN